MCGIAGTIGLNSKAQKLDLSLLEHRGPDSRGEWISDDGNIWLGHTRLAILDLSKFGDQPMIDPVAGNVIVFNGEIYNHLDLRKQLISEGAEFKGNSDTETLLIGWRYWREEMLPKLEGMFGFAIYEKITGDIVLVRDRLGIKPLYYLQTIESYKSFFLSFCSEVRPLRAIGYCNYTKESIAAYLHWGSCPHEQLLYPQIKEVLPGTSLRINKIGRMSSPDIYWPAFVSHKRKINSHRSISITSYAQVVKHTRTLLENAITSHLLSDVPIAFFLSGGIDSSILVALAARSYGKNRLATFSVSFNDPKYDESRFVQLIAQQYNTQHTYIRLHDDEVQKLVENAVQAMDLPSIDAVNTYIVCSSVAAAGYKVAISGLGSDELFGGYPIFQDFFKVWILTAAPKILRNLFLRIRKGRHYFSDTSDLFDGQSLTRWWRRIWNGYLLQKYNFPTPISDRDFSPFLCDTMAEISWGEISHYMRDMLLRDSDIMSMAHSLELRVPFLDNAIVEYVISLPARFKFKPGVPKSLLLDATKDIIPQQIWNRQKMGFTLPMREWMLGPLNDFTKQGINYISEATLFTKKTLADLWKDFERGKLQTNQMWSLSILGHYLRQAIR